MNHQDHQTKDPTDQISDLVKKIGDDLDRKAQLERDFSISLILVLIKTHNISMQELFNASSPEMVTEPKEGLLQQNPAPAPATSDPHASAEFESESAPAPVTIQPDAKIEAGDSQIHSCNSLNQPASSPVVQNTPALADLDPNHSAHSVSGNSTSGQLPKTSPDSEQSKPDTSSPYASAGIMPVIPARNQDACSQLAFLLGDGNHLSFDAFKTVLLLMHGVPVFHLYDKGSQEFSCFWGNLPIPSDNSMVRKIEFVEQINELRNLQKNQLSEDELLALGFVHVANLPQEMAVCMGKVVSRKDLFRNPYKLSNFLEKLTSGTKLYIKRGEISHNGQYHSIQIVWDGKRGGGAHIEPQDKEGFSYFAIPNEDSLSFMFEIAGALK